MLELSLLAGQGLVVNDDPAVTVGATLVGQDVADQLQAATVASWNRVPLERLRNDVRTCPVMSEVWPRLTEELGRWRTFHEVLPWSAPDRSVGKDGSRSVS